MTTSTPQTRAPRAATRPGAFAILAAIFLIGGPAPVGCAPRTAGPYAPQQETRRNPIEAQRLTRKAATLIETDADQAEQLLRRALSEDLYHGPAHNNLGVIHLARGNLYSAASEFEWARKLMPGHPDPRLNLAVTLERAGRRAEAMSTYESALQVYPGHIPTLQAITRLALKSGTGDLSSGQIRQNLEAIALRGESQEWRDWAAERLAAMR